MALPSGRSRVRIAKRAVVELARPDASQLKETAVAENISPRGIRVATQHIWGVGSRVLLTSAELGINTEARVVYCHRIEREKFAVGLELLSPGKEWNKTQ
jgi:hypothetical protein